VEIFRKISMFYLRSELGRGEGVFVPGKGSSGLRKGEGVWGGKEFSGKGPLTRGGKVTVTAF